MFISNMHLQVFSPLAKWMVFVFFFSPCRPPGYYKRAFYIGEYGAPIETQLYHHFQAQQAPHTSLACQFPECSREIDTNQLKSLYLFRRRKGFLVNSDAWMFPYWFKQKEGAGCSWLLSASESPHRRSGYNPAPIYFEQSHTLNTATTFLPCN